MPYVDRYKESIKAKTGARKIKSKLTVLSPTPPNLTFFYALVLGVIKRALIEKKARVLIKSSQYYGRLLVLSLAQFIFHY